MHNIMLVDMIDTLQDLTYAVTTERGKREQTEEDELVSGFHYTKKKMNRPTWCLISDASHEWKILFHILDK